MMNPNAPAFRSDNHSFNIAPVIMPNSSPRTARRPRGQPNPDKARWQRIKRCLKQGYPLSELASWTYGDYARHMSRAMQADRPDCHALNSPRSYTSSATTDSSVSMPLLGTKTLDGLGTVFSMSTIWCADGIGEGRAHWPQMWEMKWEGDDRVKTNYNRYLPPPRVPSNETVDFRLLPRLMPFHFDRVNEAPTDPEDVFLDYDMPFKEDEEHFIGACLINHLSTDDLC